MNKKKIIIPVVIVVLISLLVLLSVFVIYPKFIKNNSNTNDKTQVDDKNNNENNTQNDDKNNSEDDNKEIYEKYKDIEWAETNVKGHVTPTNDGIILINIIDGKLECYDDEYKFVCNLASSINEPIKKIASFDIYNSNVSLLTESGKVYVTSYDYTNNKEKLEQILKDLKIIDMSKNITNYSLATYGGVDISWLDSVCGSIFYLTDDGRLIDQNGQTYEDLNKDFIYSSCFASTIHSHELCLYFSKDNSVSYRFESRDDNYFFYFNGFPKKPNYTVLKDRFNNNLIAKYVYDILLPDERNMTLIVDDKNNLYEIKYGIEDSDISIKHIGEVLSSISVKHEGEYGNHYSISLKLSNGEDYKFDTNNTKYFDISTHTWVDLDNANNMYTQ